MSLPFQGLSKARYGADETIARVLFKGVLKFQDFSLAWAPCGPSISRGWNTSPIDLSGPVTQIDLSAAFPDLLNILSGDTGDSHLQRDEPVRRQWKRWSSLIWSKRVGVSEQYLGAHQTSHGLILNSCHRLLHFGFYWSENFESNLELFPEFCSGQVCVRGLTEI